MRQLARHPAKRVCAVCERSLLTGERAIRFSPDGEEFVDVCPLCQEVAIDYGWVKEGSPTSPDRPESAAPPPPRHRLAVRPASPAAGRSGRVRADPSAAFGPRAANGRGCRHLQLERLSPDGGRHRKEPRRAPGEHRAPLRGQRRADRDGRVGHLLVPVPRQPGVGASRSAWPSGDTRWPSSTPATRTGTRASSRTAGSFRRSLLSSPLAPTSIALTIRA